MLEIKNNLNIMPYQRPLSPKAQGFDAVSFTQKDRVEFKNFSENKKENKFKKWVFLATGIVLAVLALFNRKKIVDFFKKLFKKAPEPETKLPVEPAKPPKADTPQKTHVEEYEELERELKKARNSYRNASTEEEKAKLLPIMSEASDRFHAYEERANTENFSLIEKRVLDTATEQEKLEYFTNYAFKRMQLSEATAFDVLDMFEKYGKRVELNKLKDEDIYLDTTLSTMISKLPNNMSDKLISRFLDVFDKFAVRDNSKDLRDIGGMEWLFTEFNCPKNVIASVQENTLIKATKVFKKMIYDKKSAEDLKMFLETVYTDPRHKYGKIGRFVGNARVKAAFDDLLSFDK